MPKPTAPDPRRARPSRSGPPQGDLFGSSPWPEGLRYAAGLVAPPEAAALLEAIAALPLEEARYKSWRAKRRIVSYGGRYDFDRNELEPAGPIPPFLEPLRERVARWSGLDPAALTHALVAEYRPGTQLGWHRDVPDFGAVVGVSLGAAARMRFRPYRAPAGNRRAAFALDLEPGSAYVMTGPVRWDWQHAISPTKGLRYSITFRTLAERSR